MSIGNPAALRLIGAAALSLALTACGGGGGGGGGGGFVLPAAWGGSSGSTTAPSTGTSTGSGSTGGAATTPTVVVASDILVAVDKTSLSNVGTDLATLTVTALDASRNVLAGVPVAVTVDNGAVFAPTSAGGASGADGTFVGKIAIGADKSNRLIRYTVKSGALSKTGTIAVTGVQLSASGSSAAPGQTTAVTVTVKDAGGAPISGAAVSLSGLPGVAVAPVTSSATGQAVFSLTAPGVDGSYPLSLAAAGATASYDLIVQTAGSTTIPAAVGPISSASTVATPVVVAANTAGSSTNQSEVRVLFVGAANNPINNVRVRFAITSTALPGEALSAGGSRVSSGFTGLVYSDTTGVAKASYIAPTTGSPNDGVLVQACYATTDFAAGTCPQSVTAKLTVTANPVSLTIGLDNVIQKSTSGIFYVKKFEVQAVNAAGNYAAGVPLSAKVDILDYRKAPAWSSASELWCRNEDTNRNGVLDTLPVNEDVNGDGQLTPRQADVAIGFTGSAQTDASGLALLQLQYPQNKGGWLRVRITVTAGVSGSEGVATYDYVLGVSQDDVPNGAFLVPPYGTSVALDGQLTSVKGGVRDGLNDGCQVPN